MKNCAGACATAPAFGATGTKPCGATAVGVEVVLNVDTYRV